MSTTHRLDMVDYFAMPELHIPVEFDQMTDVYLLMPSEYALVLITWNGAVRLRSEIIDLRNNPELACIYADGQWDAETVQDLILFVDTPVD